MSSERVREAMLNVDRKNYSQDMREAYQDNPHSIGTFACSRLRRRRSLHEMCLLSSAVEHMRI